MNRIVQVILVLFILLGFAATARAQSSPVPAAANTPASALDPILEERYREECEARVTQETEKAQASLKTLYYGTVIVLVGVLGLGVYALFATRRQQQQLDQLVQSQGKGR